MKIDSTIKMCISFLLGVIITKWVFPNELIIPVAAAMVVGLLLISIFSTVLAKRQAAGPKAKPKAAKKPAKKGKNEVGGTVKWFNRDKGFGFIEQDGGGDVFVHYKDIEGSGRRFLRERQQVIMTVVEGEKGPQAVDVRRV